MGFYGEQIGGHGAGTAVDTIFACAWNAVKQRSVVASEVEMRMPGKKRQKLYNEDGTSKPKAKFPVPVHSLFSY